MRYLMLPVVLTLAAVAAQAQAPQAIPAPRGFVSDFAQVVTPTRAGQIDALARYVSERSGGEIAVVTLADLGGREVGEVALQIGREWKLGAKAEIGDARRNAGVVVLLVPKESSADGRGYISIQVGQGAEGFIPDAVAADIRREATPYFAQRDYSTGLALITARLAERYAEEFGFSLDSAGLRAPSARRGRGQPQGIPPGAAMLVLIVAIILLTRGGRGGCAPFIAGQVLGHAMGRRGYHHGGFGGGGSWGGGGGGGGGGFGGFGGGGGFSGGGSSGSF
ncbi:MAG: TPM domain-containing protein [Gemmatimonadota bacterium]|nr:TPM domain-containing protein [Gemmatimonadota bacterium]